MERLSVFRSSIPEKSIDFSVDRFKHFVHTVKSVGDGKRSVSISILENRPPVDQLLDASWTNVDDMLMQGITLPSIHDYCTPSIELINRTIDAAVSLAYEDIDLSSAGSAAGSSAGSVAGSPAGSAAGSSAGSAAGSSAGIV